MLKLGNGSWAPGTGAGPASACCGGGGTLSPRTESYHSTGLAQSGTQAQAPKDIVRTSASARAALMRRLGAPIAEKAGALAAIEARDNGKLMAEMLAQLRYVPQWYYYYGGLADKVEGAVIPIDKPGVFHYTRPEPVGVVVAITPWNSPLLLAGWKLAPALAAG